MAIEPAAEPLDPGIFDSASVIEESGQLAPLLQEWNEVVRGELSSVQSFPRYDRLALSQQRWHQCLVTIAAVAGGVAVILAILQLSAFAWPQPQPTTTVAVLAGVEYLAAILAIVSVALGLSVAFHVRWRALRMKVEQYRFLKSHFLLHAERWLARPAPERIDYLRTMLAGIHALDSHDAHHWAQGVFSLYRDDPAVIASTNDALSADLVRYLRIHRMVLQRDYFERQAVQRLMNERGTRLIPPACFFLSIVFAFAHFAVEIWAHQGATHVADKAMLESVPTVTHHGPSPLMIGCLLGAAAFPVLGAMFRTIRTAFEFGRNAIRFEGIAHVLRSLDEQLAEPLPPAARMELLREAECLLQYENRSWMRLMIEAEWFG
jgi:hypothetical protein